MPLDDRIKSYLLNKTDACQLICDANPAPASADYRKLSIYRKICALRKDGAHRWTTCPMLSCLRSYCAAEKGKNVLDLARDLLFPQDTVGGLSRLRVFRWKNFKLGRCRSGESQADKACVELGNDCIPGPE